jgi:hypothetical protein
VQGEPYRQPAPLPPDPYLVAWAVLRRRRRWIGLGFVGLMPLAGALFGLLPVSRSWHGLAIFFGSFMAIPLGLFILARLPPFPCPACDHAFFRLVGGELSSAHRCEHCDLVVGTALDPLRATPDPPPTRHRPRPVSAAAVWLLASLAAWNVALAGTSSSPWMAVAALAVDGAGVFAAVRKSWPRLLMLPAAALIAGAVCGVLQWRANEQATQRMNAELRERARVRSAACPPRAAPSP